MSLLRDPPLAAALVLIGLALFFGGGAGDGSLWWLGAGAALALLGDLALPLALWRRRLSGMLLAYVWLVALVLTYSRGGLATAVVIVVAYLALADERIERGAVLVAAALPAATVAGIAFALP